MRHAWLLLVGVCATVTEAQTPAPMTAVPTASGIVRVGLSTESDCGALYESYSIAVGDGLCRTMTVAPVVATRNGGNPLYGAALCDAPSGKVFVRLPFNTQAECVASVTSPAGLAYDPDAVTFTYNPTSAVQQCIAKDGVSVTYYQLQSNCVPAGTPPGTISHTSGPVVYTNSPLVTNLKAPESTDDGVPEWMIATLVILLVLLFTVCVVFLVRKANELALPDPGDEDAPASVNAHPPDHLVFTEDVPRPRGPPPRAMEELHTNPVVNPTMQPPKVSEYGMYVPDYSTVPPQAARTAHLMQTYTTDPHNPIHATFTPAAGAVSAPQHSVVY